jgi:UDP-N-acetylmuramoyl-tripeptide--D-alanyl-D-alanine ligase
MIRGDLDHVARLLGGKLHGSAALFAGVTIDSRRLQAGALFVALPGAQTDGHAFLGQARAAGAAGALVSRLDATVELPQVVVPDPRAALIALAIHWRAQFTGPVVALTGSNGKTTVKEMIAAILGTQGPVWATPGNYNNELGLPLSLLGLDPGLHWAAVFELGANHSGEIAELTAWTRPRIGLITQAGRAHLEGFGSVEGVARAKGELLAALPPEGVAVINADDPYADYWAGLTAARVMRFGLSPHAQVRTDPAQRRMAVDDAGARQLFRLTTPAGEAEVALGFLGRHNLRNALAAAAVGVALDLPMEAIAAGLARAQPAPGRLNWLLGRDGTHLIDDSYNANPTSLQAAVEVLAEVSAQGWLVLGDMAELGENGAALHGEIGAFARDRGISRLYAVGPLSAAAVETFGAGARHYTDQGQLVAAIAADLARCTVPPTILVKGSRRMAMEGVITALRQVD